MLVTIEVEYTGCETCIFKQHHYGHGECWDYCNHPHHDRGIYENIVHGCNEDSWKTPQWCPLLRKNNEKIRNIHR